MQFLFPGLPTIQVLQYAETEGESSLIPRPHPAFHHVQYGEAIFVRAWGEPGNETRGKVRDH